MYIHGRHGIRIRIASWSRLAAIPGITGLNTFKRRRHDTFSSFREEGRHEPASRIRQTVGGFFVRPKAAYSRETALTIKEDSVSYDPWFERKDMSHRKSWGQAEAL